MHGERSTGFGKLEEKFEAKGEKMMLRSQLSRALEAKTDSVGVLSIPPIPSVVGRNICTDNGKAQHHYRLITEQTRRVKSRSHKIIAFPSESAVQSRRIS
jgi:hypothetical protein